MPRRVRPPEFNEEQRRIISLKQTMARPKEYREEYHEKPTLFSRDEARLLYAKNYFANPSYISVIAGIDGRLSAIVGSPEFRAVLSGMTVEELGRIEQARLDKVARDEAAEKDPRVAKADEMIGKLQWALTALGGTHNGYQEDRVESFRQTAHLGALLKRQLSNGATVYSAMKDAAALIRKDDPTPYVPKSKLKKNGTEFSQAEAQEEINPPQAEAREEINPPQAEAQEEINPPQADSQDEIKLSQSGDKRQPVPYNLQGDMIDDLYYLDDTLNLGLDMPTLDPGTVVTKPDLRNVNNWEDYLKAQTANIPHDREDQQERLANVLLGAFELNRQKAAALQGKVVPPSPFQKKVAEKNAAKIRKMPVFKQLCKDPRNVRALLRAGSTGDVKRFNATINIFRPFATTDKAQSMLVLEKLKGMVDYMDPKQGRSSAWKALIDSITSINLNEPNLDPEKKLKEIYDKDCAYLKGKKSLRKNQELQNRFDQGMDVLAVLAEAGEFARMASQSVVDRVNEVRTGSDLDYKPINLNQFGAGDSLGRHANVKRVINGLDPIPDVVTALPVFPGKKNFERLEPYTNILGDLQSKQRLQVDQAAEAIATAIALSKRQVYYFNGKTGSADLNEKLQGKGRAVVEDKHLDDEIFALMGTPAVKSLARKYVTAEARQESLLKELPPEPQAIQKNQNASKHVSWADRKTVYDYDLDEEQYDPEHPDEAEANEEFPKVPGKSKPVGQHRNWEPYDPKRLDVAKLLREYEQVKRQMEAPQISL